jgi:hypothetical protein
MHPLGIEPLGFVRNERGTVAFGLWAKRARSIVVRCRLAPMSYVNEAADS